MLIGSCPPRRLGHNPDHPGVPPSDDPDQQPVATADFVDVSHHQRDIDWAAYAASGKKLAICKATESNSWTDTAVQQNRATLSQLGLACGLYHFAGAGLAHTIKPAEEEADWYLSQVGTLGPKEFPVLDFEMTFGLTPAQQVDWIGKWCARVEEKGGKRPWVYVPTYLARKMEASSIAKYPLWIANYQSSDPSQPPSSFSWPKLTAWQFTEKATFPGLPGKVDGNYLFDPSAVPA